MTNDWQSCQLVELTPRGKKHTIVDGPFGSNLKTEHYRPSGIPIVTSGFVTTGRFRADKYLFVDQQKFDQEKRSAVHPGDIVMAKIGARSGASALLPINHRVGILSGNSLKITIDESRHSKEFVALILSWLYERGELEVLRSTGAQPAISMPLLKRLILTIPSHREQVRIAAVIGEADDYIQSLERLIAKKQSIKQGMIQQLLTGRTRLPGDSGGWTVTTIGQIAKLRSGRSKAQSPSGQYWIVDMGSVTREGEFVVTKPTSSSEGLLNPGELVMPKDDIGGGLIIGRTGLIKESNKYVLADHVYALTPLGVDSTFLNYLINSHEINVSLRSQATGSAQLGLSRKSVIEQCIRLPATINEQKAIAEVISESDLEMNVLRQRLTKARAIKTGMMQQLLTGRTRLPAETAS